MKINTSDLTGVALTWAVAQCENRKDAYWMNDGVWGSYAPTTNWALAGPIIEREKIELLTTSRTSWEAMIWDYQSEDGGEIAREAGSSPLKAAMRCYVASKLGDEVDVPEIYI